MVWILKSTHNSTSSPHSRDFHPVIGVSTHHPSRVWGLPKVMNDYYGPPITRLTPCDWSFKVTMHHESGDPVKGDEWSLWSPLKIWVRVQSFTHQMAWIEYHATYREVTSLQEVFENDVTTQNPNFIPISIPRIYKWFGGGALSMVPRIQSISTDPACTFEKRRVYSLKPVLV